MFPTQVVIKVADHGGGIPRSKVARIFSFSAAARPGEVAAELADQDICRALGPDALDLAPPDILHESARPRPLFFSFFLASRGA